MKRRVFNLLAAVSLVMAIAVAALWVRSVWWASDGLHFGHLVCASESGLLGAVWGADPDHQPFTHDSSVPHRALWWLMIESRPLHYVFAVPDWMLIAMLVTLPVSWLVMRLRRRNAVGLCAKCGYDLRGSPGPSCPECGATIPAKTGT